MLQLDNSADDLRIDEICHVESYAVADDTGITIFFAKSELPTGNEDDIEECVDEICRAVLDRDLCFTEKQLDAFCNERPWFDDGFALVQKFPWRRS